MSNTREVATLFDLSLDTLCNNMNSNIMAIIMKYYPPEIILKIVGQHLLVSFENQNNQFVRTVPGAVELAAFNRGRNLAHMKINAYNCLYMTDINNLEPTLEYFSRAQQTKFDDQFYIRKHFKLNLFFKLVDFTFYRKLLYLLFQVSIQYEGLEFPKKFAMQWIQDQKRDNRNTSLYHIERGLKLGIFLGDTGWYSESARVLYHTYTIIMTRWECNNEQLKMTKTIQCLTKLLSVTSIYHNFLEAQCILPLLTKAIEEFTKMEGKSISLAYAYVSISYYHYLYKNNEKSWTWAMKSINELQDNSSNNLKLLVINNVVKISMACNKINVVKQLLQELYMYKGEIEPNFYVDMLEHSVKYSSMLYLTKYSISNYYLALDLKRNLFGYYNLSTALIFVNYSYARYLCEYSSIDLIEAIYSITQGIFIMNKLGLPENNLLLRNALHIKALLFEKKRSHIYMRQTINPNLRNEAVIGPEIFVRNLRIQTRKSEAIFSKSVSLYLREFGSNHIQTATLYDRIGEFYQSQGKLDKAGGFLNMAIEIKQGIFDSNDPELAAGYILLGRLYACQEELLEYAEHLYLQAKDIYISNYGNEYYGLLSIYTALRDIYQINDPFKYDEYINIIRGFRVIHERNIEQIPLTYRGNCTRDYIPLDSVRRLTNNSD